MNIKDYRKKRDFQRTTEPTGRKKGAESKFLYVIQKHAARRLHYDFRLEMGGVLKSWAVPKGPSMNPNIKRLAVHVEDHPLEYASFEGIIPTGQYGAGKVEIWDHGKWKPERSDFKKAYNEGHLTFELLGEKLKGFWQLIRLKNSEKDWLLIKIKDDYSNKKVTNKKIFQQEDLIVKKIKQPENISPELATLVDTVPEGKNWLHETKFDGYRFICIIKDKKPKLLTRNKKDWTTKFQSVAKDIQKLNLKDTILDGEIVVLDKNKRSDFQLLQNALQENKKVSFIYYVFDIIYYDGYDLSEIPLIERKKLLHQLISSGEKVKSIRYTKHSIGNGEKVFREYCQKSLEGIISKNIHSLYRQKRTADWLKVKCTKRQEFVVGGFTAPKGGRTYFGSLLIGFFNTEKIFQYCGHVGTGFTQDSLRSMAALLNKNEISFSPFEKMDLIDTHDVRWVKPKIVIEVAFSEWTRDNVLRHPSFKGLRKDKKASEIILENAMNLKEG